MALRPLGLVAYEPTWRAMQAFTRTRTPETRDQAWLLEHPPVFTLGLAGPAFLRTSYSTMTAATGRRRPKR